jgi:hypothetical protein
MTLQDWGAVGEILGGVAVVLTLGYLAVQLKRSARATHRQTYHASAEAIAKLQFDLAQDAALHQLYRRALSEPDTLSADERLQAFYVLDSFFSLMEAFYLHNTEFREVASQERWTRILTRLLATPGGARYWSERRWQYHVDFARYVDRVDA